MKKLTETVKRTVTLYFDCEIPRSAAALSYYLTMTVFPMLIFLYALFGQSYTTAMNILNNFRSFLTPMAVEGIETYLKHIASSNNEGILVAAAMVMLMPASAAIRLLETTIDRMQGVQRFRATVGFLSSIAMAVVFVLMMYFAILVMLTGRNLLNRVWRHLPGIHMAFWWFGLRFLLLAGGTLLTLWGLFAFCKRG